MKTARTVLFPTASQLQLASKKPEEGTRSTLHQALGPALLQRSVPGASFWCSVSVNICDVLFHELRNAVEQSGEKILEKVHAVVCHPPYNTLQIQSLPIQTMNALIAKT